MGFKYAQIDDLGRCTTISFLSGEVNAENMIPLSDTDDIQLGDTFDGVSWIRAYRNLTLEKAKQKKLAELQAARDNEIYTLFTSTALDGTTPKTYNYDREAAGNFRAEATLLSLDTTKTSVDWYVIEDGLVTHTRDQFIQVIRDADTHERPLKMKYFSLEANVKAATTADDVQAIVW